MLFINADDTNSFYKLFGQSAHRAPVSMRLKSDGKHNNSQVLNITYGPFMPHLWIKQPDPQLNKHIFLPKRSLRILLETQAAVACCPHFRLPILCNNNH